MVAGGRWHEVPAAAAWVATHSCDSFHRDLGQMFLTRQLMESHLVREIDACDGLMAKARLCWYSIMC